MSVLENIPIERVFKGEVSFNDRILMLGNRRLNLFRKAPCCPECKTQQVQCIKRALLAKWRCRHCKHTFVYEPLQLADSVVVTSIRLLINLSGDWHDNDYFDLYLPMHGVVVGTEWKTYTFKPHPLVVDDEVITWINELFPIRMRYTNNTIEFELGDLDYRHLGNVIGYNIVLIAVEKITLQDGRIINE